MGKLAAIILLLCFLSIFGARAESWSSIESEHFVVMFTGSERTARDIQELAEDFYPKVTSDVNYSPSRKMTIWFFESRKEFKQAASAPIQDWAAGFAYPLQARVVIRDPDALGDRKINLSRLIKHEIAHVIFGLHVGENLKNVPRWFNEGLAMYEAEEWSYGNYWTMLTGVLSNSLLPLYELADDFPQNESQARTAYAQSCSIVTFMVDKYGIDSLRGCIRLIAEGRVFDEAMAGAIGIDSYWLEKKWLKDLKNHYKWISFFSSWVVLWGFVVFIALIAYFRRKVKNRRIIKQWEAEEDLWWEYEGDEEYKEDEEDEYELH